MRGRKIENCSRRRTEIFVLLLFLLAGMVLLLPGEDTADAAGQEIISSNEDFYRLLSKQIQEREALKYYQVSNDSLAKRIVYSDLDEFEAYFNPDDPLGSGCYIVHYVKTIYYSYAKSTGLRIMIEFLYPKDTMDAHFQRMKNIAASLKRNSEYESVQSVHDYLIEQFEYDRRTNVNHTDIEGFRDKQMVCSGYSLAAYYLLNSLGIETRVITGYGGEGTSTDSNHMWNMVKVDGQWYNLDITWDDGGGSKVYYTYFLKNDAEFPEHIRLGQYAPGVLKIKVADESYKLPLSIRLRESRSIMLLAALAGVLIVVLLSINRRKQQEYERQAAYLATRYRDRDNYPENMQVNPYPENIQVNPYPENIQVTSNPEDGRGDSVYPSPEEREESSGYGPSPEEREETQIYGPYAEDRQGEGYVENDQEINGENEES